MQDSSKIWLDKNNKWHIQVNNNDSATFLFYITDQDETVRDLTGKTTTFKVYAYLSELDAGTPLISKTCVNSVTTGYTEVNLLTSDIVLSSRKTYMFELKTTFTADSSVKSIIGDFHVI